MIKFKELFCIHKYKQNNRSIGPRNIAEVECIKCGMIKNKSIDKLNMASMNYIWCDCGRDLVNVFSDCTEIKDGVYRYTCSRCGEISYFDFNICGLFPVQVDEEGDVLERNMYEKEDVKYIRVPLSILGNFDNKFLVYNSDNKGIEGYANKYDAIRRCKKDKLYFTRIID